MAMVDLTTAAPVTGTALDIAMALVSSSDEGLLGALPSLSQPRSSKRPAAGKIESAGAEKPLRWARKNAMADSDRVRKNRER